MARNTVRSGKRLPALVAARVTPGRTVELHLSGPATPIAPFRAAHAANVWWCPEDAGDLLSPGQAAKTAAPYPALVTLGTSPDGSVVLGGPGDRPPAAPLGPPRRRPRRAAHPRPGARPQPARGPPPPPSRGPRGGVADLRPVRRAGAPPPHAGGRARRPRPADRQGAGHPGRGRSRQPPGRPQPGRRRRVLDPRDRALRPAAGRRSARRAGPAARRPPAHLRGR